MALVATTSLQPAYGDPGDIFTVAAPALSSAAPAATGIRSGDASVASKTGAFTYSFPIQVPAGRNGMQPSLGLSYSSQAPIYGTLAAGWSLGSLPIITEDTSAGRLSGTTFYSSSMAGGQRLVAVTEPGDSSATQFRARLDSSWVRYEKFASGDFWWRAKAPDGTTYYFGDKDAHTASCTIISAGYAPLTRTEDAFGNRIDYVYQAGADGECRIRGILWGQNTNAGVGHFAAAQFDYTSSIAGCSGAQTGAQTSFRTGTMVVTGASELVAIRVSAFSPMTIGASLAAIPPTPEHLRTISLTYSGTAASCDLQHGAYRALTKIQETAVGFDSPQVVLPALEFAYGDAVLSYPFPPTVTTNPPWSAAAVADPAFRNLGWGYRPRSTGAWPTVEAMMIDIDGDGLIDRLVNEPVTGSNNKTELCRARWFRNRGPAYGNAFESAGYIEMPTLKWATETATNQYCGGTSAGANQAVGAEERCALNYQRTAFQNSANHGQAVCHPISTTCPSTGYCAGTNDDCSSPGKYGGGANTYFSWRWFDIDGDALPDLVGSPTQGGLNSYNLQWGNGAGIPADISAEPSIFGPFPGCPSTSFSSSTTPASDPYTMCGGMFPWFVFKNHGGGVFGKPRTDPSNDTCTTTPHHATWGRLPDEILYQPIPLESSSGDSSITSNPMGETQGTVDLDGDGFADAVRQTSSSTWSVYRNKGNGQFRPATGSAPFAFATGTDYSLQRTDLQTSGFPKSVEGLIDLNGDGLADHWNSSAGASTSTFQMNDGVQFRSSLPVTSSRLGTDADPIIDAQTGSFVCSGFRNDARRPMDIDGDGRVDVVRYAAGTTDPKVEFNHGSAFGGPHSTFGFSPAVMHRVLAKSSDSQNACTSAAVHSWQIRSDMIDLDGDGIAEAVDFGDGISSGDDMQTSRVATPTQPPRLLIEIKNNRGATTSVAYDSMNGPTVQQFPDQGKSSPQTNWVVKSVSTFDSFANTTTATSYRYIGPRFHAEAHADVNADVEPQRVAFRGFDEVQTTAQSGALTIERFSYSPDWSGRLTAKLVRPAVAEMTSPNQGDQVRSIDTITWDDRTLFSGKLTTYHAVANEHYTCANSQTEAACIASPAAYTKTTPTLTALASTTSTGGPTLLWQETSSFAERQLDLPTDDNYIAPS